MTTTCRWLASSCLTGTAEPCSYAGQALVGWWLRSRESKLREGRTNNDSHRKPRLATGQKLHAYHITAAYQAYFHPILALTIDWLRAVSKRKAEGETPSTILHGCGHKWCVAPEHFTVGPKRRNGQQVGCCRALGSAINAEEMEWGDGMGGLVVQAPRDCSLGVFGRGFFFQASLILLPLVLSLVIMLVTVEPRGEACGTENMQYVL